MIDLLTPTPLSGLFNCHSRNKAYTKRKDDMALATPRSVAVNFCLLLADWCPPRTAATGRKRTVQIGMMSWLHESVWPSLTTKLPRWLILMGARQCSMRWPMPPIVVERSAPRTWSICWSWRNRHGRGRCSSTKKLGTWVFSSVRVGLSASQEGSLSAGRREGGRALSKTELMYLGFAGRKSVKLAEPY